MPRAFSRKVHAGANFDMELPLTGASPVIECRTGIGAQANEHQVVFKYWAPPTAVDQAVVFSGRSTIAAPVISGNEVILNLTQPIDPNTSRPVPDRVTLVLFRVNDGSDIGDVGVQFAILAGDTNADTRVNVGDTNQVKGNSGQATSEANFRTDVNLDGRINVGDVNFVKNYSGASLPPP